MPNIKQQEKRVRVAARQRLENLRYRSRIKTLTRRLRDTVDAGGEVEPAYKELVRTIDKAAAHGALHRNNAARKKSQAAQLAAASPAPAPAPKARGKAKAEPKS